VIQFSGRGILLDIEGTTSSISFVYDEMFPYVRAHLSEFIDQNWDSELLNESIAKLAVDAGKNSPADWLGAGDSHLQKQQIASFVIKLMDDDVKATGLKDLQGKIWKSGFESGALRAHVYPDVRPAIEDWREHGCEVRIYSSGSIAAQKLFFAHSIASDMLSLFSGHYDTTIGGKKEMSSYEKIAAEFGLPSREILFISDVIAELDAASQAGLQTALSIRPGNPAIDCDHQHPTILGFQEIQL